MGILIANNECAVREAGFSGVPAIDEAVVVIGIEVFFFADSKMTMVFDVFWSSFSLAHHVLQLSFGQSLGDSLSMV